MDPADLLEGLTPAQRDAVVTDGLPLCILAGAGSGKTRVLTRRIAYRVATGAADARHVLALTFTRRAAAELGARLARLGIRDEVAAGTFHAVAYAQLRSRWLDRGERPPSLLDGRGRLLARLIAGKGNGKGGPQPVDLGGEIDWAKARMVAPADYEAAAAAAGRRPPLPLPVVASLFERYEEEKHRKGLIDFDDLLLLCTRAFEHDDAFAAAQRWRFRHLFVDEFQDVNPLQFRLLETWRGGRDDVCVVGDPNQAIYAWNGADPELLRSFPARFPKATVVRLADNFRSTPQVLVAAEAVLRDGNGDIDVGDQPLVPHRADGSAPTVLAFADDLAEAKGIARAVRERRRPGTPWSWIAVLARTHAQLALIEEAFRAAGIPARLRGTPLLAVPEVRDTLHDIRRDLTRPFAIALGDLDSMMAGGGPLGELAALAHEYDAIDSSPTIDGFLAWLKATERGADATGAGGDGVDLATFHAAKGLEWPVVFVAGLEEGFVPVAHAATQGALAEERRLLYVALTRAEHELHCSWARRRTLGRRTSERAPSPWLGPVEQAVARPESRPAAPPLRSRRRAPEPSLLTALRSWRASLARAAGVPPGVVLHDRALAAVAAARPTDTDQLLDIPGIGPVKVRRYGEAILDLVARPFDP